MAVLTRASFCILALMLTAACRTGQEQWGPFRGQIVDFDTGDPIAGAHVMVMWLREPPALHLRQTFYDARETTSGSDGWFEIPSERRWMTAFVTEPAVSVFVPGYVMEGAAVVTGDGRAYIDPTFIGMRPLTTSAERCRLAPLGPNADADSHVPRYVAAQNAYKAALRCDQLE
jgi:hypothetical protein